MLDNDLFFQTIIALIVPAVVGLILIWANKVDFIWAKVNQPTMAAVLGGIIAGLYRIPSVYQTLHSRLPDGTLADFLQAGIIAGLAGAGAMSVMKDVKSGAIKTNSEAGVRSMRSRPGASSADSIGS